jgi:hypothetical protein
LIKEIDLKEKIDEEIKKKKKEYIEIFQTFKEVFSFDGKVYQNTLNFEERIEKIEKIINHRKGT